VEVGALVVPRARTQPQGQHGGTSAWRQHGGIRMEAQQHSSTEAPLDRETDRATRARRARRVAARALRVRLALPEHGLVKGAHARRAARARVHAPEVVKVKADHQREWARQRVRARGLREGREGGGDGGREARSGERVSAAPRESGACASLRSRTAPGAEPGDRGCACVVLCCVVLCCVVLCCVVLCCVVLCCVVLCCVVLCCVVLCRVVFNLCRVVALCCCCVVVCCVTTSLLLHASHQHEANKLEDE
jgi:hypothetical protein